MKSDDKWRRFALAHFSLGVNQSGLVHPMETTFLKVTMPTLVRRESVTIAVLSN
ncbi:hypothetical protein IC006_1010 [Sulfuracidifex tepidarius]|uniref:Uncharacterized protein n=1 Tax=Sulfuracidifex tepidarius TaxID=1294262 RepID=A0A510DUI9_9CREN|nr:hypothetical protein IC006_1010 [Sulfuracidifex tepidarius]